MKKNLIIFLLLSFLFSCKKENNCFISQGKLNSEITYLDQFSNIEIHDFIDVNWEKGYEYKLKIEGGKNFVSEISAEIKNQYLVLKNKNGCKLLRRNIDNITITVFCPFLDTLTHKGNGKIVFIDTMRQNIWVNSFSNQGTIKLKLNNDYTKLHLESGSNDIHLKGSSRYCDYYNFGTNQFYAKTFQVDSFRCHNRSNGVTEINTRSWLQIEQNGDGNIHYWGNPGVVNVTSYLGNGDIIKQ